jgi:outer membrane protein
LNPRNRAGAQGQTITEEGKTEAEGDKSRQEDDTVHIRLEKPALEGEITLTLNRAIELALERNPDLVVEKIRLERAREKIKEEKGNYDPMFSLNASMGRKDNVVASRFLPSGLYIEEERSQGLGFGGRTYTGGRYSIDFDFQRLKSTSNTQTLSPQYAPTLTFSLSHSLLRDFGLDVNLSRIRVAEKGEEIAEQNLSLRLSRLVQEVDEAYWNVVYLRADLEVKKNSLEVAQGLLKQNEDLLKAGRVASVSVLEARAGVAAREEEVVLAEADMKKGGDRLKLLLHANIGAVDIVPLETPRYEEIQLNPQENVDMALKQRPELVGLQVELEQREIEKRFAYNQTLPRLDLTAQYGMVGSSGRPNKTLTGPGGPSAGSFVAGSVFEGETRPKDAFDQFFTHSPFDNWSIELKLQIPLGIARPKRNSLTPTCGLWSLRAVCGPFGSRSRRK